MKNIILKMKKEVKQKNILKKRFGKFLKSKRGIISDYLPWVLIAVVVLVILSLAIFVLRDKGISIIDGIKKLFWGRG